MNCLMSLGSEGEEENGAEHSGTSSFKKHELTPESGMGQY